MVRYALVDINQIRQNSPVTDDELKAHVSAEYPEYQVQNRVHAEHILFHDCGQDGR